MGKQDDETSRSIEGLTIEVHRMGSVSEEGVIRPGESYIALGGPDAPAVKREMKIGHEAFLTHLHYLRYPANAPANAVSEALEALGRQAAAILPDLPTTAEGSSLQVDLVLGASELWALPFEACIVEGAHVFADRASALILTRRIRQGFGAETKPWPVRPHVLFVHAPAASDLEPELIDAHREALNQALMAWSPAGRPETEGLLRVELALGPGDVAKAVRRASEEGRPFTHVHVLAHGKAIRDSVTGAVRWGLRLGDEHRDASGPEQVAEVLQPEDGLPAVVTVAACDSANQGETAVPKRSFAQELHRRGIRVVVASQIPLTKAGSVTMTQALYDHLLRGDDVRHALHETRLALKEDEDAGHDWVSVVGYVQLPQGYAEHLIEVGVKREMALLRAARHRLTVALGEPGLGEDAAASERAADRDLDQADRTLDRLESNATERIESLERRLAKIPLERSDLRSECHGILASAHKRLAELRFRRRERAGLAQNADATNRYERASLESLRASSKEYSAAFRADIRGHWLGVQALSLKAVLEGSFHDDRDWRTTLYAAELAIADNEGEYWAYGTLAELYLLKPLLGGESGLEDAAVALNSLRERSVKVGNHDAVVSTRNQLQRYVTWWTNEHGFFPGRKDLAGDASQLLERWRDE